MDKPSPYAVAMAACVLLKHLADGIEDGSIGPSRIRDALLVIADVAKGMKGGHETVSVVVNTHAGGHVEGRGLVTLLRNLHGMIERAGRKLA